MASRTRKVEINAEDYVFRRVKRTFLQDKRMSKTGVPSGVFVFFQRNEGDRGLSVVLEKLDPDAKNVVLLDGYSLEEFGVVVLNIGNIRNIDVDPNLDVEHTPVGTNYAHASIINIPGTKDKRKMSPQAKKEYNEKRKQRLKIRTKLADKSVWVVPIAENSLQNSNIREYLTPELIKYLSGHNLI